VIEDIIKAISEAKEIGIEVNFKINCMFVSQVNSCQIRIMSIRSKSFEDASKFRYLGTA
jgi:hypothetical protein